MSIFHIESQPGVANVLRGMADELEAGRIKVCCNVETKMDGDSEINLYLFTWMPHELGRRIGLPLEGSVGQG